MKCPNNFKLIAVVLGLIPLNKMANSTNLFLRAALFSIFSIFCSNVFSSNQAETGRANLFVLERVAEKGYDLFICLFPLNYRVSLMECFVNHLTISEVSASSEEASAHKLETTRTIYKRVAANGSLVLGELSSKLDANINDINYIQGKIRQLEQAVKEIQIQLSHQKRETVIQCIKIVKTSTYSSEESVIPDLAWLDDDTHLSEFVKEAYKKFGGINNLMYILNFIDEFKTCHQERLAAAALFQVIAEKADEKSRKMFYLLNAVRVCSRDFQCSNSENCNTYLHQCVDLIRNGMYQEVYFFAEAFPIEFQKLIPHIITSSISADIRNFDKVFQFITGLPVQTDEDLAFYYLYKEMRKSVYTGPEVLMLEYRAKKMRYTPNADQYQDRWRFDSLHWGTPGSINYLLNSDSVVIINGDTDTTLGIGENRTLSCIMKLRTELTYRWKIEVIEDGRYIIMKDAYQNRALGYVEEAVQTVYYRYNEYDDLRSDDRFHWQVNYTKKGYLHFKNRKSSKILTEGDFEVGSNCKTIETVDVDSNQEKSLWYIMDYIWKLANG